jgi:transcriptional regulator with XRE-family HTH domain
VILKTRFMEIQAIHLGRKIKKLRELKNMSMPHIASEMGISTTEYEKMELGETEVTYSKLNQIAEIFGMSADEIISYNEQMVFNVMHNQTGNGFVVNKGINDAERKLYEDQIDMLKTELTYLKKVLDKLLND